MNFPVSESIIGLVNKDGRYAVIKAAGAQHLVGEGEELDLFRLAADEGKKITFAEVLLLRDGAKVKVGRPLVKGAKVEATVVKHHRGEKLRVATYKAKSRYRRVLGHRDELTRVKVEKIAEGAS